MRPLLLALLTLAACTSDTPPPSVAAGPPTSGSNPVAMTDSIPEAALRSDSSNADYETPVTLVSMTAGDAACYLTVRPDGGAEHTEVADFRMCERSDLVGQKVVLTVTPSQILADSCEGNPECRDLKAVNMVTGMDPADAAPTL